MSVVPIVDAEQFATVGQGATPAVIDFSAEWCGPCKKIGPQFLEMSEQFDAEFVKVDVDENEETTTACNITNMPTFQFYKGGKKVDELCGADAAKLRQLVEKHR